MRNYIDRMNYMGQAKVLGSNLTLCVAILCTLLFFAFSLQSHAQTGFNTSIQSTPAQPGPYETFSVSLTSTETDLNRANIDWYLNDKLGLSGVGKVGFTTRTGQVGTYFNIQAIITTLEGRKIIKNLSIRPQDVTLLWRGHTHTPSFYKGLPMPSSASFVVITAMPNMVDINNTLIDPTTLVYTWSQNGIVLGEASGYGKQTIVLENGQIQRNLLKIKVSVSSLSKSVSGEEEITIPIANPEILFYQKHPLEGVLYNTLLTNPSLEDNEFIVRAIPLYFSQDDIETDKLLYKWKSNNKKMDTSQNTRKDEVALRGDGSEGSANISLDIFNDNLPFRIFQTAKSAFTINLR